MHFYFLYAPQSHSEWPEWGIYWQRRFVTWSVCLSVCWLVPDARCGKTVCPKPIVTMERYHEIPP